MENHFLFPKKLTSNTIWTHKMLEGNNTLPSNIQNVPIRKINIPRQQMFGMNKKFFTNFIIIIIVFRLRKNVMKNFKNKIKKHHSNRSVPVPRTYGKLFKATFDKIISQNLKKNQENKQITVSFRFLKQVLKQFSQYRIGSCI